MAYAAKPREEGRRHFILAPQKGIKPTTARERCVVRSCQYVPTFRLSEYALFMLIFLFA